MTDVSQLAKLSPDGQPPPRCVGRRRRVGGPIEGRTADGRLGRGLFLFAHACIGVAVLRSADRTTTHHAWSEQIESYANQN